MDLSTTPRAGSLSPHAGESAEEGERATKVAAAMISARNREIAFLSIQRINPKETEENTWYGPYMSLFSSIFPVYHGYSVAPQLHFLPSKHARSLGDAAFFSFEVTVHNRPICFFEIKPGVDRHDTSKREQADGQMRTRLSDLLQHCLLPQITGFSFFGSKFAIYSIDTRTRRRTPPLILDNTEYATDTAPIKWWCHDLLTDKGEATFDASIENIKQQAREASAHTSQTPGVIPESPLNDLSSDSGMEEASG